MIDTLIDFAMDNAKNDVSHHRSVLLNAIVIDGKGGYDLIGGHNLQTEREKSAWLAEIGHKARERRAQAVILTAPVSRGVYNSVGRLKFKELQAMGISLRIDDGVKLGLCKKVDSILVSLQTPLQTVMYTQDYEYVGGKVVFGESERVTLGGNTEFAGMPLSFFAEMPKSAKPS
jgi:hypothetical protein